MSRHAKNSRASQARRKHGHIKRRPPQQAARASCVRTRAKDQRSSWPTFRVSGPPGFSASVIMPSAGMMPTRPGTPAAACQQLVRHDILSLSVSPLAAAHTHGQRWAGGHFSTWVAAGGCTGGQRPHATPEAHDDQKALTPAHPPCQRTVSSDWPARELRTGSQRHGGRGDGRGLQDHILADAELPEPVALQHLERAKAQDGRLRRACAHALTTVHALFT